MTEPIIVKVEGMTCGHCAKTVERAARAVPGVANATVDLEQGELRLEGSFPRDAVVDAIRGAGYEA